MRVRRFFEDDRGRLVLWQVPNPPLILWGVATAATWMLEGDAAEVAALVAFGAIFTWGWLELTSGVTPFRRLLGAVVLVGAVATRALDLW